MMMIQKPMVYVEEGVTFYRASSLLQCPTAFIHTRRGEPQRIPKNLQTAFDEGNAAEPQVIEMLLNRGHEISFPQQEVVVSFDDGALQIIGHIDGKIDGNLLEIKALSHDNTVKFLDNWQFQFPYYAWQISAYMWGTLLPAKFAIWDKGEKELHIVSVPDPVITLDNMHERVKFLEGEWKVYQSSDVFPSCTTTTFCPFYHLHKEYSEPDPTTIDITPNTPLAGQVAAYEALSSRISRLEDLRKTLRTDLETTLKQLSPDSPVNASGIGFTLSYISVTSTRLDTNKARKLLGDKYAEATTTSTSTRLTVKRESSV